MSEHAEVVALLLKQVEDAKAEARHLAEYEKAYKEGLLETRRAHARGDALAVEVEALRKRVSELEAKCALFLKADAWVRIQISRFIPL